MSDDASIDDYFERIGFAGSIAPTAETLSLLTQLHAAAIPFENLDPLIGSPVRLDLRNLQQKLLLEKRGGRGLEHNILLAAMLRELDYPAKLVGARVHWKHDEDEENRPVSHAVVLVEAGGTPYLADVGFGGLTPTTPIRLRADVEQQTPHEMYRVTGGQTDWQLEVRLGDTWTVLYSFDITELDEGTLEEINDAAKTAAQFREHLLVSRAERERRLTLRNLRLTIRPAGGEVERRELGSITEIKSVLSGLFGIELPVSPKLDDALELILGRELLAQKAG